MAEVSQVFEKAGETMDEFAENFKKNLKSKPFLIALGVVVVVALVALYKKQKQSSTESVSTDAADYYYPTGIAGYPAVSGSSYDDTTYSALDEVYSMVDSLQTSISDLTDRNSDLQSSLSDLNEQNVALMEYQEQQAAEIKRQNIMAQMQTNSDLYNTLQGSLYEDERKRLHDENLAMAKELGLTFDDKSGNYYDDSGNVAYLTTQQKAQAINGKSYDPNVDYQAEINKAILSGKSAEEIDRLNQQRNLKIADNGQPSVGYDKNTDYQALINRAKEIGASDEVVSNLEKQRAEKDSKSE